MAITDMQNETRDGTFGGIRRLIRRVRSLEDFFVRKHDPSLEKEMARSELAETKEAPLVVEENQAFAGMATGYQMPLHYPRYSRAEYESMPEWQLDCLLSQYGLPVQGDLQAKRDYAIGTFLFPDQL